jgi:hypothetical protein
MKRSIVYVAVIMAAITSPLAVRAQLTPDMQRSLDDARRAADEMSKSLNDMLAKAGKPGAAAPSAPAQPAAPLTPEQQKIMKDAIASLNQALNEASKATGSDLGTIGAAAPTAAKPGTPPPVRAVCGFPNTEVIGKLEKQIAMLKGLPNVNANALARLERASSVARSGRAGCSGGRNSRFG